MNATLLLRIARTAIAISTLAAIVVHAWLTVGHAWLPSATIAALVVGAVGGWAWRRGMQTVTLGLAHLWPLITFLAIGRIDFLAIMVWVAGLTSLAIATSPLTRWSLPPRWQVPLAAWGVLLSVGWPVVLARELDFTLVSYIQNVSPMGLWAGSVRDTSALVVGASVATLSSIIVLDWLCAHYRNRPIGDFFREVAVPLSVGTPVALVLGVYQGTVDVGWLNVEPWPRLGRAAGTIFDANAFGAIAALWAAPMAGAAMLAERRVWRVIGLFLLSLAAVGVWACGSRTALLGLLPAFAGIAIGLARAGRLSRLTTAIAVLGITVTITVGWLIGGPSSTLRRVWQTLPSLSVASVTQFASAMWTRDGYGAASVEMLRAFPLTGVGPGAFAIFAPDYASRLNARPIPPDNAQNWWRHQLSELGFAAGFVPIACSLLVLAAVIGATRRDRPPIGAVAVGGLVGTGLMSLIGSPVTHPIVLLTITVLIFWTMVGSERAQGAEDAQGALGAAPQAPQAPRAPWAPLFFVWLLPIAWAGATMWVAVYELRPPYRAEAFGWAYAYGLSAPEELGSAQRRWVSHRAVGVVPNVGRRVVMTFRAAPELSTSGPIGVRVSTRERLLLDQSLSSDQTATTALEFSGQKWMMVQIETSRRGVVVDGFERVLQITTRVE